MKKSMQQVPYFFLLPALIIYIVFFAIPSVESFYYAMTDWNGINPHIHFVGLDNFKALLHNRRFIASFKNTIIYAFGLTLGQVILGLLLAILVNLGLRFSTSYRAIFFAPHILSLLIMGYIWSFILSPHGLFNELLGKLGLSGLQHNWLGDLHLALYSVLSFNIWFAAGFSMVVFLANLQSIPKDLYEAADIDGANGWNRFRYVTLPLLIPALTITLVTGMIHGFKVFDVIMSTTGGGPGYATETITTVMFDTAFITGKYGQGTAMGIVMFVLILIVSMIQITFLRKREVEY